MICVPLVGSGFVQMINFISPFNEPLEKFIEIYNDALKK